MLAAMRESEKSFIPTYESQDGKISCSTQKASTSLNNLSRVIKQKGMVDRPLCFEARDTSDVIRISQTSLQHTKEIFFGTKCLRCI